MMLISRDTTFAVLKGTGSHCSSRAQPAKVNRFVYQTGSIVSRYT